ncbi:M16 family metallopeptidase [Candidatus Ichthyocystis hellenicum]|uniref:M16 family metallopeptidase n=1 Tax=Candidatus Ichthyocystis hellenicum TaxID=1561003 RepID=UPI000A447161|nr:pitrilysin family protein [Candidatus Ichthyocystis hellenicum]
MVKLRLVVVFFWAMLINSFLFAEDLSNLSGSFSLSNGMTVTVVHDNQSPVVSVALFYRAGSIDEVGGVTGVAHACEHMMFRGTSTYPRLEFVNRLKKVGAIYNAGTDRDLTVYYEKINRSDLGYVLSLEADRMRNATLDKDAFDKELQVVIEERRLRVDDNPKELFDLQSYATAFLTSPYRNPVIGWRADLDEMTIDDVRHWYYQWYVPNNALLVLVGDVTLQEARSLVEASFSGISRKDLPVRKSRPELPQLGARYFVLELPVTFSMVSLAWQVPSWKVGVPLVDTVALQVLDYILGGYSGARLNKELIKRRKLVEHLSIDYSPISRGPGLFKISLISRDGAKLSTIRRLVWSIINDIKTNGPTDEEVYSARRSLYARHVFDQDSLSNQSFDIGYFAMSGWDLAAREKFYQAFQDIKKEDIQRVARKFFQQSSMTCGELKPAPNRDLYKYKNGSMPSDDYDNEEVLNG